jgi:hypothetical protein
VETDLLPIGTEVVKVSGKPFKSVLKVGVVAGYQEHPVTGKSCYLMRDDGTYVEARRCIQK